MKTKPMTLRTRLTASAALLAALAATAIAPAAFAAEGDEAEPVAANEVGEVIITATKRETNLQDTPIAVSVVGVQQMENAHVESFLDIAGQLPSLRVSTFESRQTALTVGIRGIVPGDANQPAREQGVGIYLDGVYLGRQQGLNQSMLDLERVEVLRGPQGTLFGRNTEGGAVSLVTRQPTGEFGFRGAAGISNFNGHNVEGHMDFPEVAGFSVKLDGALQYHDATTRNPMAGQTGWNYLDRNGFKATVLWQPIEQFKATYSYDTGHSESSPFLSQLVNYNPLNLPVSTVFPRPAGTISPLAPGIEVHKNRQDVSDIGVPQQPSIDETYGHTLNLSWDINDSLTLRSITAYRGVSVQQYDNAGTANRPPVFQPNAPAGSSARNFSRYSLSDLEQFQRSQEFQLVGNIGEDFDWVVGLYYFNEKAWEEAATPSSLAWVGSAGDYVVRDPKTAGITRGFRSIDRGSLAHAESKGIFVHTVWTPPILDKNLKITLGGRYTEDEKDGKLYKVSNLARNYTFDLSESRFDPTVTVAYDVTDDVNFYATYSTGYRAGGANSRSLTFTPFESEEVKSYEIGMKARFFDRVTLNVAAYSMDRTNSQIEFSLVAPDPVSGSNRNTVETVNAPGTTEIRGLEIESTIDVTDNLRLTLGYAYTDTHVPDVQNPFPASPSCPACGTIQPVYIIYTPPNAASAAIDYVWPLDFADIKLHLDFAYAEGTQSFEAYSLKTDDSFIVNGRLALADWQVQENQNITLSLWSRNLLDEEHIYRRSPENRSGTNAIGDYANFNEPRTFGFEVGFKF